ncbi:MAG: putative transcriptional regulatory protein for hcr operon [Microbacteriaceae bacterium]|nr:putative transcriptional regulatory protein for hcr operon [Microbacteriaceae bacterium]
MDGAPQRHSRRIAYSLSQLGAVASARFAERTSALDVTPSEAAVIRVIGRSPGLSQRALADGVGSPASRMVAIVDALIARDLVRRERSAADRRNYELRLTDSGREVLAGLRAIAGAHEADIVAPLSDAEREQLAGLLDKLVAGHGLSADIHVGSRPRTTPAG